MQNIIETIRIKQPTSGRVRLSQVGFLCCLAVLLASVQLAQAADRPNVIVILTDDQGWGDLSVNGNRNLSTPHIDSLARDGATLENFYVCSVCAPTRAEFLTGRYYPRTGVSGVSRGEERLNYDESTIADLFKAAGYVTGAFGKWHNGTQPPYHPNYRGFDEFYGFTSGHWGHYFSPPLDHNGERTRGNGFVVDDFTEHAIQFIEQHRDEPFFCYVPFNTPHSPMMVPDRFYEKFNGKDPAMLHRDAKREDVFMTRAALAMCENIDWNVGRILKRVDDLELRDRTIVVYFSDNGPNSWRWNGGMKGRKGSIDEGGLRSPFFIRWPCQIRAGSTITQIAGAIDLLPTLADLASISSKTNKPIDGRSFRPLLMRERVQWPERSLMSIRRNQVSIRTQRFRLDASGSLFDMARDRGQRNNVAADHPQAVTTLRKQAGRSETRWPNTSRRTRIDHLPLGLGNQQRSRHAMECRTERSSEVPRPQTIRSSRTGLARTMPSRGISMSVKVESTGPSFGTRARKATSLQRFGFHRRSVVGSSKGDRTF